MVVPKKRLDTMEIVIREMMGVVEKIVSIFITMGILKKDKSIEIVEENILKLQTFFNTPQENKKDDK